jgi:hypothetical protein
VCRTSGINKLDIYLNIRSEACFSVSKGDYAATWMTKESFDSWRSKTFPSPPTEQVRLNGNSSDLYSGGAAFESRPGH